MTLSLAGRTRSPAPQPVATRVGGFGGAAGLAAHLRGHRVDLLVDATHPFAEQISANATAAARQTGVPLIAVGRAPWQPREGDRWTEATTMEGVVDALGAAPRRVFLTIGRLRLAPFARAPQHTYLLRTIDPLDAAQRLPNVVPLEARGPFDVAAEEDLMRRHRIDVLVTKNSGGMGAAAKLDAARRLGLPVVLLARPAGAVPVRDVASALQAIRAHGATAPRGV